MGDGEVEARRMSLYLPDNLPERFQAKWIPVRVKKTRQNKNLEGPAARSAPRIEGVLLGKRHPFIHVARAKRIAAVGCGRTVKG
jgi:hypothetical protein